MCEYLGEIQRMKMLDDEEDADEKSEIADAVDDESFFAGRRRRVFGEPEANQQIRRQAHALPPDEHHQIVVGQHQRQHEKHEQVEVGEEAIVAGIVPHVPDGVDVNQKADAGHDQQHDERKLIDVEGKIDNERTGANPMRQIEYVRCRRRREARRNPQRQCKGQTGKS